jgi:hypothetical protein
MIVLGEAHLRWILSDYGRNDNDVKTQHLRIKIVDAYTSTSPTW